MRFLGKKYLPGLLLALIFILSLPLPAGEDDGRDDAKGLYLYPYEVIRPEEISLLDTATRLKIAPDSGIAIPYNPAEPGEGEGDKDLGTKINEADGLLRRYYSQFLNEKRIWEDKNRGSKFSTKNEQNEVRLLIDAFMNTKAETEIIRDSEIVYNLHKRLAELYDQKKDIQQAIRHYTTALRYRDLSHTEDRFLDEQSWKEVLEPNGIQARQNHKLAFDRRRKAIEEVEDAKRIIHKLGSDFSLNKISYRAYQEEKKSKELDLTRKKNLLEDAEKSYQASLEQNYEPFRKLKSREDAENFYRLAQLVRKSEDANKERLKIVNKSTLVGRGIFILFDYKRNTDFFAYEYLLEKSYRIDPSFPEAIYEVAKQFKIDGKKIKSIDYFEKYIALKLAENQDPSDEDKETLADTYLNLAILNSDIKRKVIAADYYEKFFTTTQDASKKQAIVYELGRFYEKIIGDLDKSKTYYEQWLNDNPQGSQEKVAIANYGISLAHKRDKRIDREEEKLLLAYEQNKSLDDKISSSKAAITKLERDILRYKKELLLTTQDDALAQFRILNIQLDDLKIELDRLLTQSKSIPQSRILLRLAEIQETKRDFESAKKFYRELVESGNEVEANFSLKSIERVEKTQSDGFLRPAEKLY